MQIENVLKTVINNGDKLLIIAPCSGNVINTLAANVARNGLKFCNIQPPSFGYKTNELMQDIAMAVGAKYFSEKTGDDLSLMRVEDLGHADKIIAGMTSTIVIKNNNVTEELTKRIEDLRVQQDNTSVKADRDFINERIASLAGAIGCIFVGGNSDVEQKEKYDRVDDSVCAVRSALEEGIVSGGGLALYSSIQRIPKNKMWGMDSDYKAALNIVKDTLCQPLIQIINNAGINSKEIIEAINNKNSKHFGYDVKNEKYGNMFKMGIIDPLKVTKNALLNAVSVATTILKTNAIITHKRAGGDSH